MKKDEIYPGTDTCKSIITIFIYCMYMYNFVLFVQVYYWRVNLELYFNFDN